MQTYALELHGVADGTNPPLKKDGRVSVAAVRRSRATVTLVAQAVNDTVVLGAIPEGCAFAYAVVTSSVSLGAATIAIGNAATPAKYKAVGTFTTPDTPTLVGTTAAIAAAPFNTAPDSIILTVGAAALPGAGTLVVDLYYSMR